MYTGGPTPVTDYKYTVGIAYVAMPIDLSREDYIKDCYENFRVSLWGEDGSFLNRVPIPQEVLNFIEFPQTENTKGSPVVYITDDLQSQPIVIARLPVADKLGDTKEYEFKLRRVYDKSYVEIQGSPKTNSLSLTVNATGNAGRIYVNVAGGEGTELIIDVQGDINVTASGKIAFEQQDGFSIVTIDKDSETDDETSLKQTVEGHTMQTKNFTLNDGNEPFVLGEKFKSFMNDFIDEVGKATVTTALGQMPLINAAQILAYKEKLDALLSKVMFIDK